MYMYIWLEPIEEYITAFCNNLHSEIDSVSTNFYSNRLAVVRRSEQDGIGLEDVDALQLELEALLSATVVRKMTLKEESKILNNIEKYKGQGRSLKRVRKQGFV